MRASVDLCNPPNTNTEQKGAWALIEACERCGHEDADGEVGVTDDLIQASKLGTFMAVRLLIKYVLCCDLIRAGRQSGGSVPGTNVTLAAFGRQITTPAG